MALNPAQEYINGKLAGTVRETVVLRESLSYSEQEYLNIFSAVQKYITDEKLSELNESLESGNYSVLENITKNYIQRRYARFSKSESTLNEIVKKCIDDMTGFGFLNKYFARADELEEININGWDNIEIRWFGGRRELSNEHFHSASHARDVILRVLRQTGRYLDDNKIYEVSYIGKSVRIATLITPAVDEEVGVAASIRFIHSAVFTIDRLVHSGFMTTDMAKMLTTFVNHGVSVCVCGATGSGKTTVCNAILEEINPDTRVITLEGGTREFELVRRDDNGKVTNNRLHLQTRPHKDARLNVDLQLLLDLVLKFDPDIVVVGEMVSEEAFIASETARTGHTVMTTIHTNNAFDAYYRMYSLGIRKYELPEDIMLKFMVDAFPIIVYVKQYPDGKRRIQSILEGQYINETHEVQYNELYHYNVQDNETTNGVVNTVGEFLQLNKCTDRLRATLLDNGATQQEIANM
ncbi:MAG: CpaF family protein [Bacteroidaceae bacterium]|nr:CpaF family protein [Bacteroidaceae bacterium]